MLENIIHYKKMYIALLIALAFVVAAGLVFNQLVKPYAVYADGTKVEDPCIVSADGKELFIVENEEIASKVIRDVMESYVAEDGDLDSIQIDEQLKIEDKTASSEFLLFDKVFTEYRNFCIPGTAIAIRCSYEANRYNGKVSIKVKNIAFLKDLKGKMIKSLRINLNEKQLEIGNIIKDQLKASTENRCELTFRIHDLETNRYFDLRSRYKIPLTPKFIEQLDELGVKYNVEI